MKNFLLNELTNNLFTIHADVSDCSLNTELVIDLSISVPRNSLVSLATYLKLSSNLNYDMAVDAFAIDSPQNRYRFTILYLLQSSLNNNRIMIITKSTDNYAVLSLQNIFPAFNWAEREIWDLTGILFIKHPDLRRILTDYGFVGHPLRKDFPVSGFWEANYADKSKQVIHSQVELSQGLRLLNITSSWSNA